MSTSVGMHWFRKGLRLHDNPGLSSHIGRKHLYPVYILDGDSYQLEHCTALRANFLVECLQDLDQNLRNCNDDHKSRLLVATGDPVEILPELWKRWKVTHLTWEKDETGEPYAVARDTAVLQKAQECGIVVDLYASETLRPLQEYVERNTSSKGIPSTMGGFQTLFGRCGAVPKPLETPTSLPPPGDMMVMTKKKQKKKQTAVDDDDDSGDSMLPPSSPLDLPYSRRVGDIQNEVTPLWGPQDCQNLRPAARGGETKALAQVQKTVTSRPVYVAGFEKPKTSCVETDGPSTTGLSPYMSLGCLSPRTFWHAVEESRMRSGAKTLSKPPTSLHGQLLWRDFNNLMAHEANRHSAGSWGRMVETNKYCRMVPWSHDDDLLEAWRHGQTGFPWIDACMVQLKQEGWIHHLGRHAVACFLTRGDLWQSWEEGALHFESHLLDADYALNGFNWLWLSCSGFFYQYFRCYGPVTFQKKNDPAGQYIRKYLPVLAKLPNKYIYEPWKAPKAVLEAAGIKLGVNYPKPIVNHAVVSKENMSKMALAYDPYKSGEKKPGIVSGGGGGSVGSVGGEGSTTGKSSKAVKGASESAAASTKTKKRKSSTSTSTTREETKASTKGVLPKSKKRITTTSSSSTATTTTRGGKRKRQTKMDNFK